MHVESEIGPLLVDVVDITRREVLHQRDIVRRALEVQVYAEVREAFKHFENGFFVHL